MDSFLKWFGDFAHKQGEAWRLEHPALMDSYQAACEHYNRKFNVGPQTMKRVFEANGIVNLYDLQRVLDAMEEALVKSSVDQRGVHNMGVEKAAERVDEVWRRRRGVMNCTELCAEIRSLLIRGDDIPEFVEVVPVPQAIKDEAEKEALLEKLLPAPEPWPAQTPLLCETTSALEDAGLSVKIETAVPFMQFDGKPGEIGGKVTIIDPAGLDWHYVDCHRNVEHGNRLVGWFPTKFLAQRHCQSWPSSVRDYMVVKPRSVAPQGTELHFPQQAASDVLRETNEFLATCGIAKVELGGRYFPDRPKSGEPTIDPNRWLPGQGWKFATGDRVRKKSGAWWEGKVVGFYSTHDTPRGYSVQLQTRNDNGPVQIYPENALELNP